VYRGPSPSGQLAAAYLQLLHDGAAVWQSVVDGYSPGLVQCSPNPTPNCTVVFAVGAHSSAAQLYVRSGDTLRKVAEISADTPVTNPLDLDGDGWIDAYSAQNTYQPSYATGKVYWQTFRAGPTGLRSTGCSPPRRRLPPDPTQFLDGACAGS
jgi:hypothetical protein